MSDRFIKYIPSEKSTWLRKHHIPSFILLGVIAEKARRYNGLPDGLIIGDALLGDFEEYGLERQEYRTALKKLEEFGFIQIIYNGKKWENKFEHRKSTIKITINGTLVNLCDKTIYDINPDTTNQQSNQQLTNGQPTANHEQERIRKNNKEKEYKQVAPDVAELVDIFLKKIIERQPNFKTPSNLDKWHQAMDRILRIDKRQKNEILEMIEWIHHDSFWKSNILSPDKLRMQFDKIQAKMICGKEDNLIKKNRDWMLSMKDQYPDDLKKMKFDAKFVGNPEAGKEILFSLPEEQFQRAFVMMFGGIVHD